MHQLPAPFSQSGRVFVAEVGATAQTGCGTAPHPPSHPVPAPQGRGQTALRGAEQEHVEEENGTSAQHQVLDPWGSGAKCQEAIARSVVNSPTWGCVF